MKRTMVVALLLAALAVGGCGGSDEDVAVLKEQAKELEGRLAQLEQSNGQLKDDLQKLEWQYAALGAREGESRDGTREAVEQVARDVVRQELAAAEARRVQEQGERREVAVRVTRERAGARQEERFNQFAQALELTDQQKLQVQEATAKVQAATMEAFAAMRNEGGFDRDRMREVMEGVRKQHDAALKEILTEEQFEKYQALPENQRNMPMRGGWGGARPAGDGRRGAPGAREVAPQAGGGLAPGM